MTSDAAARVLAQVGIYRNADPITEPTLTFEDVPLLTLTEPELHDLIYAAASQVHQAAGVPKAKAQEIAARIGDRASVIAMASDYRHEGPDPRA